MSGAAVAIAVASMVSSLNAAQQDIEQFAAQANQTVTQQVEAARSDFDEQMGRINKKLSEITQPPSAPVLPPAQPYQAPDDPVVDESEESVEEGQVVENQADMGNLAQFMNPDGSLIPGTSWYKLASCESGHNPSVVSANGLYSGLFQFSEPTWRAVGGAQYAPTAGQATPAQQLEMAIKLQQQSGWGQWPACSAKYGLR